MSMKMARDKTNPSSTSASQEKIPQTPRKRPPLRTNTPSTTSTIASSSPAERIFDRSYRKSSQAQSPNTPPSEDEFPFFEGSNEEDQRLVREPKEHPHCVSGKCKAVPSPENSDGNLLELPEFKSPSVRQSERRLKTRSRQALRQPPIAARPSNLIKKKIARRDTAESDSPSPVARKLRSPITSSASPSYGKSYEEDSERISGETEASLEYLGEGDEIEVTERRSVQMEPYFTKRPDCRAVNNMVRKLLAHPNINSLRRDYGYTYIFKASEVPDHVKIGRTEVDPPTRLQKWQKTCRITVTEVEDGFRDAFRGSRLVEKLVHAELAASRYKLKCKYCKKNGQKGETVAHDEWFTVEDRFALQVVDRWRGWIIEQKPYSDHGDLTAFWAWRVRKLPSHISSVRWETWTKPSWHIYWDFYMETRIGKYYLAFKAHQARKDWKFLLVGLLQLWVSSAYLGRRTLLINILFLMAL